MSADTFVFFLLSKTMQIQLAFSLSFSLPENLASITFTLRP